VDVAAMAHANDPPEDLLLYGRAIEHVHASELHLKPLVGNDAIDHCRYAQALRRIEYANWVSIEMKEANSPGDNVGCVGRAIDFGQAVYGV
jgi:sugar phosphate isomerase/epimerase